MKNKYAILKIINDQYFSLLDGEDNYPITFETIEKADKYANAYELINTKKKLRVISIDSIHE